MSISRLKSLLITGGAGFIGSAFIRFCLPFCERAVNLDLLTYAANKESLAEIERDPRYVFVQGDIGDEALVERLCKEYSIDTIIHFAAESHVDRSISAPKAFFETNVRGTLSLLEVIRRYPHIHFHHVSTDEVYGSLGESGFFDEESAYRPNSPYSASKAASDHCVRAYANTYGLSTTLSHCSNNYGPYQHPEKLIPLVIDKCLRKEPIPIYGKGDQVRDWLYVDDHVNALWAILNRGKRNEVYDISACCELKNRALVFAILRKLSAVTGESYESLVTFVAERPGHDFRYAIDSTKIQKQLGWRPRYGLEAGLEKTILWTLERFSAKLPTLC
jgi:dTDP-glucose 4,6-dehydratase